MGEAGPCGRGGGRGLGLSSHVNSTRTQVAIVGAGPAGLMLSHLLHARGIESIVLECRSRDYVEDRVRAGVLEHNTVEILCRYGLAERLKQHGLRHDGLWLSFAGARHHINMSELTGGKAITVYGQHEVVRDLIQARVVSGAPIEFEIEDLSLHDIDAPTPIVRYRKHGAAHEIVCDWIAGCDGSHGVCRPSARGLSEFERVYPFAWLGILADAPPSSDELVYTHHERGFALFSMRSPEVTRLYLQVDPDEPLDQWPDGRIWEELQLRMGTRDGWSPNIGAISQKGITPMRSFVAEPMQSGKLFLAGDAAHIVPPTGAKGLNLAIADVAVLARAMGEFYASGRRVLLDQYSDTCLRRVWKVQRFSWWMTSMLHRCPGDGPFDRRRQLAELDYVTTSRAAMTALAENYVGLPLDVE
jgi:p-hydroxybenzoate 3-monooxygenase